MIQDEQMDRTGLAHMHWQAAGGKWRSYSIPPNQSILVAVTFSVSLRSGIASRAHIA